VKTDLRVLFRNTNGVRHGSLDAGSLLKSTFLLVTKTII